MSRLDLHHPGRGGAAGKRGMLCISEVRHTPPGEEISECWERIPDHEAHLRSVGVYTEESSAGTGRLDSQRANTFVTMYWGRSWISGW